MGQQLLSFCRFRFMLSLAEDHMVFDCKRFGIHFPSRFRGLQIGMEAHSGESTAKTRLKKMHCCLRQRLSSTFQGLNLTLQTIRIRWVFAAWLPLNQRGDLIGDWFGWNAFSIPARRIIGNWSGWFRMNHRFRHPHPQIRHTVRFLFVFVPWVVDHILGSWITMFAGVYW